MRMAITRRPASAADVDFLYALRETSYRVHVEVLFGPWLEDQQRVFLANDMAEASYEIVERDGVPIGGLAVCPHADHDFLEDIMIVPAHQGHGIGTALMRELMDAARARGVALRLSVLDGNRVRALYERLGFRVTLVVPPRTKMEWP
jgi:ribosomal protein S18 acetylase RimI-like enzyme